MTHPRIRRLPKALFHASGTYLSCMLLKRRQPWLQRCKSTYLLLLLCTAELPLFKKADHSNSSGLRSTTYSVSVYCRTAGSDLAVRATACTQLCELGTDMSRQTPFPVLRLRWSMMDLKHLRKGRQSCNNQLMYNELATECCVAASDVLCSLHSLFPPLNQFDISPNYSEIALAVWWLAAGGPS